MVLPAYVIDADTGDTLRVFGMEVETAPGVAPPYLPQRWALARSYTVPAVGPGHHPWSHWGGALLMLLAVFALLGRAWWA